MYMQTKLKGLGKNVKRNKNIDVPTSCYFKNFKQTFFVSIKSTNHVEIVSKNMEIRLDTTKQKT